MSVNLSNRDFLKELDYTQDELQFLIDLARELKDDKRSRNEVHRLSGRNIALIFEKTSTRTRCAFEVAAYDQGGHVTYLDPASSQLGHKESPADTARVLGRMFDAIEFRGKAQATVEELAEFSDVPVYNGLTDEWHPTQMLADFQTMSEHAPGRRLNEITYCFMGDGRFNMARSLLVTGAIMGSDVRICAPRDMWPDKAVQDQAAERAEQSGARITLTDDPAVGLVGADFVHTDVWVSMGEPKEVWSQRVRDLTPYQVNRQAMAATGNPDAKFMHCLPAFHDTNTMVGAEIGAETGLTNGLEVTDDVFTSAANIAFDQAENRLHTIKALMVATLG